MIYAGRQRHRNATLIRDVGSIRSIRPSQEQRDIARAARDAHCFILAYGGTEGPGSLQCSLGSLTELACRFERFWAKRLTQQKPKTKVIIMNNGIAGKVAVITAASSLPKPDPHPQVANKNLVMVTS